MRKWKIVGGTVLGLGLVLGVVFLLLIRVPKPQVASAQGSIAPDFTLKDQDGRDFTLSSLRGSPVLLILYRGYW